MFGSSQLIGFRARNPKVVIVNTDDSADAGNLTTYTFSTQSLGAAQWDRVILVGAAHRATANNVTIDSCTIDGNAATSVVNTGAVNDTTNSRAARLFARFVPTGTTADIVVTLSAAAVRAGIGVWAMYGTNGAITAFNTNTSSSANPTTANVNIPAEGAAVAFAFGTDAPGLTWSGFTESFDSSLDGQVITGAIRHVGPLETASPSLGTGAGTFPAFVTASWEAVA
jgi:hypothetical protein